MLKNKEGYADPTAGTAIREVDRPPEHVSNFIKKVKYIANMMELEVIGRIQVRDKKTNREY